MQHDIKNLIIMQKASELLAQFDLTCGQGKGHVSLVHPIATTCKCELNEPPVSRTIAKKHITKQKNNRKV